MDTSMRDMLVTIYHLEALPENEQNAMIEKIAGLIFQGVLLRVAPQMTEEQQSKMEQLAKDNAAPEAFMDFLSKEVPNLQTIVAEEAQTFYDESQALMNQIGK